MCVRAITLFFLAVVMTGCTTISVQQHQPQDFSKLYLRGVFTWWEADPQYKVVENGSDIYTASVKLIADGQPYDFKFADANWTPGLACGPQNPAEAVLTRGARAVADCENPQQNFKFTPQQTGTFRFYFDAKNADRPVVYIKRLSTN